MIPTPFDTTVLTVIRPGRKVRNGTAVADWATATEHTTAAGTLDAGDSTEDHDSAAGVTVEYTWSGPMDTDVRAGDRVRFTYAGEVHDDLQVYGRPARQDDGTFGLLDHVQVRLVKREGA